MNVSLASNPFKGPRCTLQKYKKGKKKKKALHYGSRATSSIRLSGCLYVILAIRAVLFWLIVCSGGDALGTWVSITLTFVLLLDVSAAQAHQSHLEAENSHFAVSSTSGKKREGEKKETVGLEFWTSNQGVLCRDNHFIHWAEPCWEGQSVEELRGSKQYSTGQCYSVKLC